MTKMLPISGLLSITTAASAIRKKYSILLTSTTSLPTLVLSIFLILLTTTPTTVKCDDANLLLDGKSEKLLNIKSVNYSPWNGNVQYLSSSAYNARGMAPLYNITNTVINLFMDEKNPIPDGYIVLENKRFDLGPNVKNNEWGDLLKKYWAILLVVLLVTLVAALMPIIGFCFCCCRCAGACGGRTQPFDKKGDTCRRFFFGLFLICIASSMVFGVVVAFVTNSYMQHGVENATTIARSGINDTKQYLRTTSNHIRHMLVDNYNELKTDLEHILNDTGDKVIDELNNKSKAIELVRLNKLVSSLPEIRTDLEQMKQETNDLRNRASRLSDGLRGVKRELLTQLSKCNTAECKNIKQQYEIGRLDSNGIDYNQLPDMTNIISGVQDLINNAALTQSIKDSQEVLEEVRSNILNKINSNLPVVEDALTDTGRSLKRVSDEVKNVIDQFSSHADTHGYKNLDVADKYLEKYGIYRFYAGLIISSILLVVLLCVTFGLMCGICGKRPDGYGDDCCNKGAGGRFLMCGVAIIFLTISVLLVITLALFLIGIVARRGICDPLQNPANDKIFTKYIDPLIDLHDLFPEKQRKILTSQNTEPLRISNIIERCHNNETIYHVLNIEKIYDTSQIKEIIEKYKIDEKIKKFVHSIQIEKLDLVTPETKQYIQSLGASELNEFDEYKFLDNLTKNITFYNLAALAEQLEDTANKINHKLSMKDIRVSLLNQALILRSFQKELVEPMIQSTDEMLKIAKNLERVLKNGENSFQSAMEKTLSDITDAQDFFNNEATEFVKKLANDFLNGFKGQLERYLDMIAKETEKEVGKCGPISQVYNATLIGACKQVVDPYNGFWAGVAWCLALFFPTIIFAVKLSTLYQKSDPYPGPLVEAEYMYDAYSERDNIPLANGPKNRKRNKKRDRRAERHAEYYEDASPSTGHHRDARYNDMAPKNWDGAPPRYQNPPVAPSAEYERPPPYYYPGAQSDHD